MVLLPPYAYSPSDEHASTVHTDHEQGHRDTAADITDLWRARAQMFVTLAESRHTVEYDVPSPMLRPCDADIPVFYVNLDRHPARRAHIEDNLERAGFRSVTRVPAVEGADWIGTLAPYMNAGETGCTLSHFEAARRVLAAGHSHALIVEDDVRFDAAHLWPHSLRHWMDAAPRGWTTIQVSHSSTAGSADAPTIVPREPLMYYTSAYLISREGCARDAEVARDVTTHAGDLRADCVMFEFEGASAHAILPSHAYAPSDEHASTIHQSHEIVHIETAAKIVHKWAGRRQHRGWPVKR